MQFVKDSSLSRTLEELSRSRYSWEELQRRPLPDGVDPAKLEKYLSDEDFEVRSIQIIRCSFPHLQLFEFVVIAGSLGRQQVRLRVLASVEADRDPQGKGSLLEMRPAEKKGTRFRRIKKRKKKTHKSPLRQDKIRCCQTVIDEKCSPALKRKSCFLPPQSSDMLY